MEHIPDTFHIHIHNPKHSEIVQKRLFDLNFCWLFSGKTVNHTEASVLTVGCGQRNIITYPLNKGISAHTNYGPQVSTDDLFRLERAIPKIEHYVVLNSEYRAKVSSEGTVTVGKDSFTFDAIEKLASAVKEMPPASTDVLPDKFQLRVYNQEHCLTLQKRLFELGYIWSDNSVEVKHLDAISLQVGNWSKNEFTCTTEQIPHPISKYGEYISTDDLFTKSKVLVKKVVLNEKYTAEVSSAGRITVGCQSFRFGVVDALVDAMIKVKA